MYFLSVVESNEIALPKYGTITYNNAVQEKYFQSIILDVTATTNGHSIFFEILVTHPVDMTKELFYGSGGYKSVEINLKGYLFTTLEDLRDEILKRMDRKRIIFWEKENVKQYNVENWIITAMVAFLAYFGIKALCNFTKKRNR